MGHNSFAPPTVNTAPPTVNVAPSIVNWAPLNIKAAPPTVNVNSWRSSVYSRSPVDHPPPPLIMSPKKLIL